MVRNTVFVSYSHQDKVWKHRISTQLPVLQQQGLLKLWCDRDIGAGQEWFAEIDRNLQSAKLAVLVISADFLASDIVATQEVPRLLRQHEKAGMRLFPVLARDCAWQAVRWLARLQMRPTDARPLAEFRKSRMDRELANIAREVREYLSTGIVERSHARSNTALQSASRVPTPKRTGRVRAARS
jgi:hypothetical protein